MHSAHCIGANDRIRGLASLFFFFFTSKEVAELTLSLHAFRVVKGLKCTVHQLLFTACEGTGWEPSVPGLQVIDGSVWPKVQASEGQNLNSLICHTVLPKLKFVKCLGELFS